MQRQEICSRHKTCFVIKQNETKKKPTKRNEDGARCVLERFDPKWKIKCNTNKLKSDKNRGKSLLQNKMIGIKFHFIDSLIEQRN